MKDKIKSYKLDLKSPYTGMTEELKNKIEGIEVDENINYDFNNDGKIDGKDDSLAGKKLAMKRKYKNKKGVI